MDKDPSGCRQGILGAVAAAPVRGVSESLLLELLIRPWRGEEIRNRIRVYIREGLITSHETVGRMTYHATPALLADRAGWKVRR